MTQILRGKLWICAIQIAFCIPVHCNIIMYQKLSCIKNYHVLQSIIGSTFKLASFSHWGVKKNRRPLPAPWFNNDRDYHYNDGHEDYHFDYDNEDHEDNYHDHNNDHQEDHDDDENEDTWEGEAPYEKSEHHYVREDCSEIGNLVIVNIMMMMIMMMMMMIMTTI